MLTDYFYSVNMWQRQRQHLTYLLAYVHEHVKKRLTEHSHILSNFFFSILLNECEHKYFHFQMIHIWKTFSWKPLSSGVGRRIVILWHKFVATAYTLGSKCFQEGGRKKYLSTFVWVFDLFFYFRDLYCRGKINLRNSRAIHLSVEATSLNADSLRGVKSFYLSRLLALI